MHFQLPRVTMSDVELHAALVDALHAARQVEASAETTAQQAAAVHASGRLMLAAQRQGWTVTAMAKVLGISRHTASYRVCAVRDDAPVHSGLAIPSARPPDPLAVLVLPVAERDVLTMHEALEHAEISFWTLRVWRRAGLLPRTIWPRPRFALYAREDLDRVLAAPRYKGQGRSHAAVLAAIAGTPSP